ncbi:MAG: hypothetical protein ACFFBD_08445 [Candidatus Hodarchaeota archaeon]
MKFNPIPFLLTASNPIIKYNTLKNLSIASVDEALLTQTNQDMLQDPLIRSSVAQCLMWGDAVLKRHNDATHPIHRLEILAEFGLTKDIPDINHICETIMSHQSPEGAFLSNILVPKSFKGSGVENWDWIICDAPILLYFLAAMGYVADERVVKAKDHLVSLVRDNGFGCVSSIPKFRGPGRKDNHCPYANLLALKALAYFSDSNTQKACQVAIQAQVDFWNNRGQRKFYLFGIGTDFQRMKYPNVYYNIIHVLDVLSLYKDAQEMSAFQEMLEVVNKKQATDGFFTPESTWRAFSGYDFGQKKEPSPTLTYKIALINHRCGLLPSD